MNVALIPTVYSLQKKTELDDTKDNWNHRVSQSVGFVKCSFLGAETETLLKGIRDCYDCYIFLYLRRRRISRYLAGNISPF